MHALPTLSLHSQVLHDQDPIPIQCPSPSPSRSKPTFPRCCFHAIVFSSHGIVVGLLSWTKDYGMRWVNGRTQEREAAECARLPTGAANVLNDDSHICYATWAMASQYEASSRIMCKFWGWSSRIFAVESVQNLQVKLQIQITNVQICLNNPRWKFPNIIVETVQNSFESEGVNRSHFVRVYMGLAADLRLGLVSIVRPINVGL